MEQKHYFRGSHKSSPRHSHTSLELGARYVFPHVLKLGVRKGPHSQPARRRFGSAQCPKLLDFAAFSALPEAAARVQMARHLWLCSSLKDLHFATI